jgi:ERCC4-type nuclease
MEDLSDDDLISHVFDARINGRLARWDYTTIGQLRELSDEELWDIRGVGPQSVKYIREVIPSPETSRPERNMKS